MLDKYLKELHSLGKGEKKVDDLIMYQVKIGDLRAIIKRDKLQGDKKLALQLINSKVYEAMILGYLILNTDQVDKEEVIKLSQITDNVNITSQRLSIFVAENKDFDYLSNYFKNKTDDNSQVLYYASLMGHLSIDPDYNVEVLSKELAYISENILKVSNDIVKEMNSLVSTIAIQVPSLSDKAIETYNLYASNIKKITSVDVIKRYESAKKNNQLHISRDSCRC